MIYFVIPAYNEERNLPLLLKNTKEEMELLGQSYCVYIVNDGSADGTSKLCAEYARAMPLKEIKFDTNQGVDRVFDRGFKEALKAAREGDIIISKEADNTSDHKILEEMIARIKDGNDVALASCFAKEGRVENSTLDRHILSFGANTLLKICFPIKGINTYSSFYRAFNAMTLKKVFEAYEGRMFEEKGFVCMVEMLVKLSRLPIRIVEVPMVLRCDNREGASKMRRRRTIGGYIAFIRKQMSRSREYDREVCERFCGKGACACGK